MIILEVKDYCQSCQHFDPDVERPINMYAEGGRIVESSPTIVRCEKRFLCERLSQHLLRKLEENKSNDI